MQHLARQTDVTTDGTVDLTSDTVAESTSDMFTDVTTGVSVDVAQCIMTAGKSSSIVDATTSTGHRCTTQWIYHQARCHN